MTVRLRMIYKDVVRELAFDRRSISIGQGPFNDIVCADAKIAGVHGDLEVHEDGDLAFRARASSLPTQVFRDGARTQSSDGVEEQTLHVRPGDVIGLGEASSVKLEILGLERRQHAVWSAHPVARDARAGMSEEGGQSFFGLVAALSQAPSIETFLRVAVRLFHQLVGVVPIRAELAIPVKSAPWRSDEHLLEQISVAQSEAEAAHPAQLVGGAYRRGRDPLPLFRAEVPEVFAELEKLDNFVWLEPHGPKEPGSQAPGPARVLISCLLGGEMAAVLNFTLAGSQKDALLPAIARFAARVRPLAAIALDSTRKSRRVQEVVEENLYWRERQRRHHLYKDLIAESDAAREVYEHLNACVEHDEPVLLVGEAGSGKALVARAMHHLSARKDKMLISINCRGLMGDELDFELFGSVNNELTGAIEARKGIFELADGGTIFLEEIDRLSLMLQGKLLRVLREAEVRRIGEAVGRRVDVRVLASTHQDLREWVETGRFRRDLYLVLCGHRLHLPPLRERKADILPLARMFLREFSARYDRRCKRISPEVEARLLAHRWQGNVRELQTVIEAGVLHSEGEVLEVSHLGL